jgi:hypothetical protein
MRCVQEGAIMKIQIMMDMGVPPKGQQEEHECLEERVESCCELIESAHESREEWDFIRSLNNKLVRLKRANKLNDRGHKILEMIAPIINKYGNQDPRYVERDIELAGE